MRPNKTRILLVLGRLKFSQLLITLTNMILQNQLLILFLLLVKFKMYRHSEAPRTKLQCVLQKGTLKSMLLDQRLF